MKSRKPCWRRSGSGGNFDRSASAGIASGTTSSSAMPMKSVAQVITPWSLPSCADVRRCGPRCSRRTARGRTSRVGPGGRRSARRGRRRTAERGMLQVKLRRVSCCPGSAAAAVRRPRSNLRARRAPGLVQVARHLERAGDLADVLTRARPSPSGPRAGSWRGSSTVLTSVIVNCGACPCDDPVRRGRCRRAGRRPSSRIEQHPPGDVLACSRR